MTAQTLIDRLALQAHPEGGHYRRIYPPPAPPGAPRAPLSAIHFLLAAGEFSAWHCVDAEEAWHFVEGEALELLIYRADTDQLQRHRLGPAGIDGNESMCVVPAHAWQAARPLGAYALCTCLVAPAFDFSGFRLLEGEGDLAARLLGLVPEIGF
ncbi:cupin domain-containing protein [Dyella tabacisoli]|uniref:Cupin domain-containing protein n=1 Tax=Dyella tabacisoli TaxID=2282381 RepID=A0A369UJ48_9GAMM|nr:cupin domain-containing protein [Dyella tabacisoli]RDD80774.1 cupin domain-containing protein [Dyella tabacisoli]